MQNEEMTTAQHKLEGRKAELEKVEEKKEGLSHSLDESIKELNGTFPPHLNSNYEIQNMEILVLPMTLFVDS